VKLEEIVRELMLLVGFASFAAGLWLVHPPAALIICGGLLMWAGFPRRGS